jgi:hypothetical protein
VLRQGHLSEQALIEAVMTGERPAHLDRCDICADRATESSRWLDEVRVVGIEAADAVFTPERLAAQQAQIMRRLEQSDEPARVIAFPGQVRPSREAGYRRRVAPAWVGVAAAAGLALGVVGGQLTARISVSPQVASVPPQPPSPAPVPAADPPTRTESVSRRGVPETDYENMGLPLTLVSLDEIIPRMVEMRGGGS